jgi:hypothetical protein
VQHYFKTSSYRSTKPQARGLLFPGASKANSSVAQDIRRKSAPSPKTVIHTVTAQQEGIPFSPYFLI